MSNPWDKPLSPKDAKKLRDNVIFKPSGGSGSGGGSKGSGAPEGPCLMTLVSMLGWLARQL